jgi:ABC-type arginine transport system permease subunit
MDSTGQEVLAWPEGFFTTIVSHGIPVRAVVIGLVFGSVNAILSLADEVLRSGGFASVELVPLGQAYVLPLVFGLFSQAITYRRARNPVANI